MKKDLFLIGLIITALVTGGCGMNVPDTEAFQDEFTRGFMKSAEEVEEGYYLFESGTGGYTILFPKNATMDRVYYQNPSPVYERVSFGESDINNVTYNIRLKYEGRSVSQDIDRNLKNLSRSIGYKGEYEENSIDNKTYYYAKNENHVSVDDKERTYYRFFSYIKSDTSNQGIEFKYSVTCASTDSSCEIDLEKQEEIAKTLIKSVQFHY